MWVEIEHPIYVKQTFVDNIVHTGDGTCTSIYCTMNNVFRQCKITKNCKIVAPLRDKIAFKTNKQIYKQTNQ
jgi:hypothetical protein